MLDVYWPNVPKMKRYVTDLPGYEIDVTAREEDWQANPSTSGAAARGGTKRKSWGRGGGSKKAKTSNSNTSQYFPGKKFNNFRRKKG